MSRPALVAVALVMTVACVDSGPTLPDAPFPLGPFQQLARNALCAEQRNDLYLLDETYVLHHREQPANCVDAGDAITLYGSTPQDLLCWHAVDNFGPDPPPNNCYDQAHVPLFTIIRSNWQVPAYGLGPDHVLEPIPF